MGYKELQDKPVVDSPNNDAFESIVELYYQSKGYITSAGKWFFAWDENKKQRGYQDIDVLAVGGSETVIVSVSSNLDDKIRYDREHQIKQDMLEALKDYFQRTEDYLKNVDEYKWIANNPIKRVVAYLGPPQSENYQLPIKLKDPLLEHRIELLPGNDMLQHLDEYLDPSNISNIKIQNQMLRLIQMMKWLGVIKDTKMP